MWNCGPELRVRMGRKEKRIEGGGGAVSLFFNSTVRTIGYHVRSARHKTHVSPPPHAYFAFCEKPPHCGIHQKKLKDTCFSISFSSQYSAAVTLEKLFFRRGGGQEESEIEKKNEKDLSRFSILGGLCVGMDASDSPVPLRSPAFRSAFSSFRADLTRV